ncbi:alanine-zipper protein, partial [Sphingobacterium sp. UT-1RO-CII-1]|uniref:alanine-zipper protein n=1 Tax=Sphingobacterium sp. UT-1RO-CII-1 TaxID=2995225 RepID=UPI00227B053B
KITPDAINFTVKAQVDSKSTGRMIYRDPSFESGLNSVKVYNNANNGNVTVTRIQDSNTTSPTRIPWQVRIRNIGAASPGIGGFNFQTPSYANAKFLTKIIALIPAGRELIFGSNPYGNGGTSKWLTSNLGTGKWEEYTHEVTCGATGTFSTTHFFYINGAVGTPSSPVDWYVSFATVYNLSQVDDTPTVSEVESSFDMTANKMKLFSKEIEMSGLITFQATNAQNTANAAQGTANTANTKAGQADAKATNAQSTANTANGTANAANNQVNAWKYPNKTTINGGAIETNTIDANRITAGTIFTQQLTAQNLTVTGSSKIGQMSIDSNGYLYNNSGKGGMDIYGTNISARIGTSTAPGTLGLAVPLWIENHKTDQDTNYGIVVSAKSAQGGKNYAISILGGMISGGSWNNRVMPNGTTTLTNGDDIIAIPNTGSYLFRLPSSPEDGKTIQFVRAHSGSVTIQFDGNGRNILYKGVDSSSVTGTVTGFWGIAIYIKATNKWFLASN